MTVAFVMEFNGIGQDKYDAVMKQMGLDRTTAAGWPAGLVSHVAGKTASGWCVVDVWESTQAFEAFRQGRLGPAFGQVGGMPEPRVTQLEVYHRYPSDRYPAG